MGQASELFLKDGSAGGRNHEGAKAEPGPGSAGSAFGESAVFLATVVPERTLDGISLGKVQTAMTACDHGVGRSGSVLRRPFGRVLRVPLLGF